MNGLQEIVPPKNVNIVLSTLKKKKIVVAPKIILMSDDIGKNVSVVLAYLPNLSHTYLH